MHPSQRARLDGRPPPAHTRVKSSSKSSRLTKCPLFIGLLFYLIYKLVHRYSTPNHIWYPPRLLSLSLTRRGACLVIPWSGLSQPPVASGAAQPTDEPSTATARDTLPQTSRYSAYFLGLPQFNESGIPCKVFCML